VGPPYPPSGASTGPHHVHPSSPSYPLECRRSTSCSSNPSPTYRPGPGHRPTQPVTRLMGWVGWWSGCGRFVGHGLLDRLEPLSHLRSRCRSVRSWPMSSRISPGRRVSVSSSGCEPRSTDPAESGGTSLWVLANWGMLKIPIGDSLGFLVSDCAVLDPSRRIRLDLTG